MFLINLQKASVSCRPSHSYVNSRFVVSRTPNLPAPKSLIHICIKTPYQTDTGFRINPLGTICIGISDSRRQKRRLPLHLMCCCNWNMTELLGRVFCSGETQSTFGSPHTGILDFNKVVEAARLSKQVQHSKKRTWPKIVSFVQCSKQHKTSRNAKKNNNNDDDDVTMTQSRRFAARFQRGARLKNAQTVLLFWADCDQPEKAAILPMGLMHLQLSNAKHLFGNNVKMGNWKKKRNSVLFYQRHALSMSFDIFVVTYCVTKILPKLVDMPLFSTKKKLNFHFFFWIPYFRVLPTCSIYICFASVAFHIPQTTPCAENNWLFDCEQGSWWKQQYCVWLSFQSSKSSVQLCALCHLNYSSFSLQALCVIFSFGARFCRLFFCDTGKVSCFYRKEKPSKRHRI